MKIHYISCARSSSVDGQTNQLSLFHILDEIAGPSFPLRLASFCVASLFEREADDQQVQAFVLAITLDGTLLASFTMNVDFSKSRRNRSVNTIQGLTIPGPGAVTISVVQKTKVLASWHALAIQTGDPQAAEVAPKAATKDVPAGASKAALALN